MADNPPSGADSEVLAKFATIGIGPGLTPSDTKNDTIKAALENGIAEGEKLIDAKVPKPRHERKWMVSQFGHRKLWH